MRKEKEKKKKKRGRKEEGNPCEEDKKKYFNCKFWILFYQHIFSSWKREKKEKLL